MVARNTERKCGEMKKITLYENGVNRCWWKHAVLVWMDLTGSRVASWWCEVDGLGVILTGHVEINAVMHKVLKL